MPRGRKRKAIEDIGLLFEIEKLLGRELTAKEKQDLAISAKNFVRDNFAITSVYSSEAIEEACSLMGEGLEDEDWAEPEALDDDEDADFDDYSGRRNDYNDYNPV